MTGRITLIYRRGSGPFTDRNLLITVSSGGRNVTATPRWDPPAYRPPLAGFTLFGYSGAQPDRGGPRTRGNLGGWYRGLDVAGAPVRLHDGLISRDGWYLLDDTQTALLAQGAPGFAVRPAHDGVYQDGYLFGYGHDYARGAGRPAAAHGFGAAAPAQGLRRVVLALLRLQAVRLPAAAARVPAPSACRSTC